LRDAKWPYPHGGLGDVYYALKRYDEAVAAYGEASKRDPKLAWPHNGAGNALLDAGRLEKPCPSTGRRSSSIPPGARRIMGWGWAVPARALRRERTGAVEGGRARSAGPAALTNLAELYYTLANYTRARELAQQALDLSAPGSENYGTADNWLRKCDEAEAG